MLLNVLDFRGAKFFYIFSIVVKLGKSIAKVLLKIKMYMMIYLCVFVNFAVILFSTIDLSCHTFFFC